MKVLFSKNLVCEIDRVREGREIELITDLSLNNIKFNSHSAPHEGQISLNEFPCNSASFSLGIPDRRWRLSTF